MEYNFDVREYNTFGLSCVANKFLRIREEKDLQTLAKLYQVEDIFLLGMGANTIFSTNKCEKTIVKIENLGKQIIMEDDVSILIEVSAGECWDDFVEWATKQKFSGLENLSAIPSSIGATPVQNIGAYGMEVKNIIEYVVCFDLKGEK
ncbi:MAG: FAD-binding protein, partial [Bacteroidota bacterium]|nr:FAD-binding protein [Bacteroidota bacterium]